MLYPLADAQFFSKLPALSPLPFALALPETLNTILAHIIVDVDNISGPAASESHHFYKEHDILGAFASMVATSKFFRLHLQTPSEFGRGMTRWVWIDVCMEPRLCESLDHLNVWSCVRSQVQDEQDFPACPVRDLDLACVLERSLGVEVRRVIERKCERLLAAEQGRGA